MDWCKWCLKGECWTHTSKLKNNWKTWKTWETEHVGAPEGTGDGSADSGHGGSTFDSAPTAFDGWDGSTHSKQLGEPTIDMDTFDTWDAPPSSTPGGGNSVDSAMTASDGFKESKHWKQVGEPTNHWNTAHTWDGAPSSVPSGIGNGSLDSRCAGSTLDSAMAASDGFNEALPVKQCGAAKINVDILDTWDAASSNIPGGKANSSLDSGCGGNTVDSAMAASDDFNGSTPFKRLGEPKNDWDGWDSWDVVPSSTPIGMGTGPSNSGWDGSSFDSATELDHIINEPTPVNQPGEADSNTDHAMTDLDYINDTSRPVNQRGEPNFNTDTWDPWDVARSGAGMGDGSLNSGCSGTTFNYDVTAPDGFNKPPSFNQSDLPGCDGSGKGESNPGDGCGDDHRDKGSAGSCKNVEDKRNSAWSHEGQPKAMPRRRRARLQMPAPQKQEAPAAKPEEDDCICVTPLASPCDSLRSAASSRNSGSPKQSSCISTRNLPRDAGPIARELGKLHLEGSQIGGTVVRSKRPRPRMRGSVALAPVSSQAVCESPSVPRQPKQIAEVAKLSKARPLVVDCTAQEPPQKTRRSLVSQAASERASHCTRHSVLVVGDSALGLRRESKGNADFKQELQAKLVGMDVEIRRFAGDGVRAILNCLRKQRKLDIVVAVWFLNELFEGDSQLLTEYPRFLDELARDLTIVLRETPLCVAVVGGSAQLWGVDVRFDRWAQKVRNIFTAAGIPVVDGVDLFGLIDEAGGRKDSWHARNSDSNKECMATYFADLIKKTLAK